MVKPTYEELQAEVWLLEEVCAFYANDEDRYLAGEGEAYGMVPVDAGMKARSARNRFLEREKENTRLAEAAARSN